MTTCVSDPFGAAAERHASDGHSPTAPSENGDLPIETPIRPGKLAYVCKMFPRITETFVLNEIVALHRAGVPVRIYSILPATRDDRTHPEALPFTSETITLPQPGWRELPAFLPRLGRCLRTRPARTATVVLRGLLRPSRRSFRLLFRSVTLADHLRRDEIAHVHAAWAHTPASVSRVASRLTQIPWSMAAHAKDIYTSGERSLALKISSARFTLACTGAHRDHLREIACRHASRYFPGVVHLAYHGVDAGYFSGPPQPAPGRPIVLSVARLVAKKGLDVLIEAAALLRDRGVPFSLEIVGEGLLRPTLERKIRELELDEHVALRGLLTLEEVREAMRRSTCFALPCQVGSDGDRDGIPNSVAEAMASGLPVVSTRLPSIEELVTHEETGLLVPPGDAAAVADALRRLLLDPEERRRLGERARAAVVERFAAERCASERVRLLAQALEIRRVLYLSGDRGVPVRGGKGASIHVRSVIGAWRVSGVETLLVTANGGPPAGTEPSCEVREARAEGRLAKTARTAARVLRGGAALERALLRLLDNGVLFPAARMAAREWRPDIVYERYALSSVAGSLLARRIGKPHVVEVNAPLADEEERHRGLGLAHLTRRLERWVLRRADLVIVVSPALREHALRQGVRPERIRVVPNGVDTRLFHPSRDGARIRGRLGLDGDFVVGFSGTLRPWHGVGHLVRALASAVDDKSAGMGAGHRVGAGAGTTSPSMKLLVMGDGPERESLEALAREHGVADRVLFLGALPHEEVGDYLAACDVLCAPYGRLDDFYFSPIKIAEYRACGRPVIASGVGHLKQDLSEAKGAILTEPGDEAAIARALSALAGDPERRRSLGRAAASSVWTWSDVARVTLCAAAEARTWRWGWPSTRPLTVGYVVKMFPRFSEMFILNEVLELERAGVRVVVFSMKPPAESVRQPGVDRVRAPVIVLPERASRARLAASHLWCFLRRPWRYARTAAFVRRRGSESTRIKFLHAAVLAHEARRLGVQHLHAHFATAPARQAKLASMLSGVPFSFTAHAKDLFWSGNAHRTGHKLKHAIRSASFVVAISEHNRTFMETLGFHVPRGRIATIYNGLDLEAWAFQRPEGRPAARPAEPPLVLAVGRLVEKKGFAVLLEAVSILADRGIRCRCWIAGEGPERERLSSLIRRSHLKGVARLLGAVRQDRLAADLYTRAHALAQPCIVARDGDQDGIPTVILEAMAIGLPVVATPVSGITEAVRDGESGLLVPPGDPRLLADALARVLADDSLAARFAHNARRVIEERFSLRENARGLLRRLRKSAHGPRTTAR